MRRFVSNLLAVAYKETRVLRHDRAVMSSILAQPIVMLFLFGWAISNTPRNVPWLVLDRSETAVSRRFVADIQATGYFLPAARAASYDDALRRMRRGAALALLVVPDDFARDAARGAAQAQLLLDGSDPLTAARVGAAIAQVGGAFQTDRQAITAAPRGGPIALRQRFRFNPTLDDSTFYLSVLGVILLTNLCLSASSLGLVGERESGTYEQMLALPTTPLEIVLGKLLPYVAVSYGVLTLAMLLAGLVFGFWPAGNFLTLCVVALPFILASLGIGVFVSAIANTSAQAVFISVFFIMPSFVLSGLMMPYEFMPHPVREIGALTPARWLQIATRQIVMRGAGLLDVLGPLTVLWGMFAVTVLAIRWRMKARLG
jgi:ABC-2 type transport system permease protein